MENTNLQDYSHKRFNILTGEWVLVSPHRAKRPWQGQNEEISKEKRPAYDEKCYLCAKNTRISGDVNPDYKDVFVFNNLRKKIDNEIDTVSHTEKDKLLKLLARYLLEEGREA